MSGFGRKAIVVVVLVAGAGLAPGLRAASAERDDPAQIALGQEIYAAHCAACHGSQLEGQPDWRRPGPNGRLPAPPHDASGHTWHHSDEVLFTITRHGLSAIVPGYESDMPAFADVLTDAEIEAVLAYIRSTWPEDARAYQAEITRQARDGG